MSIDTKINPLYKRILDVIQNYEELGIQEEKEENFIFETKRSNIMISLRPKKPTQIEKSIVFIY